MKTDEIYNSIEEFKKFIIEILGVCNNESINIVNVDIINDEIKMKYEDSAHSGIFITAYKKSNSWSDIKVHIMPRVSTEYKIVKK